MALYKQSVAYTRMILMIDSTDHFSPKTGLTVTVTLSKAGGSFAAAGGTVTEVANGFYKIVLTTTDTNTVGDLAFHCTATGADNTDFTDQIWVRDLADLAYPATSGRSMVVDANGLVDANTVKLGPTGSGTAQTARDVGASVLLSTGTGTGQLDFTSGVVKANLAQILGTALTETAGLLAGGFKKFFNIATPAATMDHLVLVDTVTTATTATNLTNAPTNGDFTAAMKTSLNSSTPASITGAVGSVTGNIGGNVIGSVASVTAAVAITSNRKKGSGSTVTFTMTDSTTGADKTGLTVAAVISKDAGSFAATSNSVTETANGWYSLVLTATEMTANNVNLHFTSAGAVTRDILIQTQP
jgi:hypothetical protein